ncbi:MULTISPECIES: bifunctional adenosylcobinamide kinase/adenosylcobinamide-phosphate guanylyltransferase [Paenibacillus]|uniref:Bifunctional adenosylcobinamide kinase/adenosylcobinamide-phosphate guanylyltransferase n=1 Tax=Paenibacillus polygoni TaxID=3050112 RepID=A0ABY8X933_9BACL|nr:MULTISPECIES: bifunctional adenosylcobinamide kinase/adenosylcobinamide-phosphate guanylyltransferase [Paenibacillus]WIV20469.1 bifunctional adenosylcobinamide kinase/adenosylcobinamide-phosphate guanylyltransferase [Paenibacillus polygoni]
MLIMVTGGVSSGKTQFALSYASTLAREGIYITDEYAKPLPEKMRAPSKLRRVHISSHQTLPDTLDHINRESNLFRADRRIVIIDSLTSWMMSEWRNCWNSADQARIIARLEKLKEVILSYQGLLLIITNEMQGSFHPSEEEKQFISSMAEMNRIIAVRSDQVFQLTSGIASEISRNKIRY